MALPACSVVSADGLALAINADILKGQKTIGQHIKHIYSDR